MKIAIIAGSGNFPIQIATQNKDAFVLCIQGHSSQNSNRPLVHPKMDKL